jgi:hypothetical protein
MGSEPDGPDEPSVVRELRALRGAVAGLVIVVILCTSVLLVALYNRDLAWLLILLMGFLLAVVVGIRFAPIGAATGKGVAWIRNRARGGKPPAPAPEEDGTRDGDDEKPIAAEDLEKKDGGG